jgi:hypothetical protein
MEVTNIHVEELCECEIDDDNYKLFASIQQVDSGGWMTYFFFQRDDKSWESLYQPSFAYGGKTLQEALTNCSQIANDDMEYLIGALIP